MGDLLDAARKDSKRYVKAGGFEVDLRITNKDKSWFLDIKGFYTNHHINFDSDGTPINSKNVHICIDKEDLINDNYPLVNPRGDVDLINHLVTVKEGSAELDFIVKEQFPNETLGLIVCVLSEYSS